MVGVADLYIQYIVIDFEYAAPNPRGYDVANHFHEWRANYHHPTHSHSLQPHFPYPSIEQREEFYRAYLSIEVDSSGGETVGRRTDVARDRIARLEREVRIWSPACSIFWALWGIVQAEEQIKGVLAGTQDKFDFDYLVSDFPSKSQHGSHTDRTGLVIRQRAHRHVQAGGSRTRRVEDG